MTDEQFDKVLNYVAKIGAKCVAPARFSELTSIGCGGKAAACVFPSNAEQLRKCVLFLRKAKVQCVLLGMGSNVLASDDFFDGVIVSTRKMRKVFLRGNSLFCEAGVPTASVAAFCQKRGLSGLEFFGCLPATVGGAVVMNAGCFGQSVQDVLVRAGCLVDAKRRVFTTKECRFAKRSSAFLGKDTAVLWAEFALKKSTPQEVKRRFDEMFAKKKSTQPLGERSMGSVFFNDAGTASRLVDLAGLKGTRQGGAEVSTMHAGFIINVDNSTSKDVYLLMKKSKARF